MDAEKQIEAENAAYPNKENPVKEAEEKDEDKVVLLSLLTHDHCLSLSFFLLLNIVFFYYLIEKIADNLHILIHTYTNTIAWKINWDSTKCKITIYNCEYIEYEK